MSTHMAGVPIELIFQDKKYTFHPLRDMDYGEFEAWAQDRYIQVTKRNIADLPETERHMLLLQSFERASLITFSSKEARILMSSVEGAAKLLHLSIRRGEPAITEDDVRKLCTDPQFVVKAFDTIAQLTSPAIRKAAQAKKKSGKLPVKRSTRRSLKGMGGQLKK